MSTIPITPPLAGWGALRSHAACLARPRRKLRGFVPKGKWPLLLAVPDEVLSTKESRGVLPATYSRADAVANIQNSMFLLAAFIQGKHELLASALEDRIHQPYRAPLCPLLPCLLELKGTPGILGTALSGAGPSAIVFLDPCGLGAEDQAAYCKSCYRQWFSRASYY